MTATQRAIAAAALLLPAMIAVGKRVGHHATEARAALTAGAAGRAAHEREAFPIPDTIGAAQAYADAEQRE